MSEEILTPETPGRFGDYELLRYFTAGGMADLYLARSPRFGQRQIVLKRIQPRYLEHTRVVKMFIDEGRIARLLEHPNIVRVLDVGQADGNWYIAMEYIHGHDLVAVGRRSAEAGLIVPRPVAVGVLAQVAAGLAYAHTRADDLGRSLEIVHCDVSPGNVVISFGGVAKIVDFGIARATIAFREEGGVAGKYNYMAPEQVRGEPFDARADLFPLGVMLHEMTVGRRLFRGRPEVVMRRVCEDPIPLPSELTADYPPRLERIVMRLLERDPDARYPSAAAALEDLRDYLHHDEEDGWDSPSIAAYLRSLFTAPRHETTDPSVVVEDVEVDRGMPEVEDLPEALLVWSPDEERDTPRDTALPDGPLLADPAPTPGPPDIADALAPPAAATLPLPAARADDGPTAAINLPVTPVPRSGALLRPAKNDPAAAEATEFVRLPESRRPRKQPSPQPAKRPGPDDSTAPSQMPERRHRAGRRPRLQLTTGVVVGGSMLMVALALLIAWFIVVRSSGQPDTAPTVRFVTHEAGQETGRL